MNPSEAVPTLLGLVADLFFAAPIETAARSLGYTLLWIEPNTPPAQLVTLAADAQPALALLDLGDEHAPWPAWVAALKTSPATRRIPIVAFGPHVDLELRARAEAAGCDVVLAKSALLRDLPSLIQKHARRADPAGLAAECAAPLSASARTGLAHFNRGEFFEAHEALETAWKAEAGPARDLYQGLVQAAVVYLQIERGNYAGALKMCLRLRQWLDPLPDHCRGVDVAQLRADVQAARAALEALGPDRLAEFDRTLLKPVNWA